MTERSNDAFVFSDFSDFSTNADGCAMGTSISHANGTVTVVVPAGGSGASARSMTLFNQFSLFCRF